MLMLSFSAASRLEDGIWRVSLPPSDVRQLGGDTLKTSAVSILGVRGPAFDAQSKLLMARPADVSVLQIGTTDRAFVIDLGPSDGAVSGTSKQAIYPKAVGVPMGRGDRAFIEECQRHLGDHLVKMAEELLRQVRFQFHGEMREGQARKWVNAPDNFLAITIQNRDQSFAIYIRGRPQDFAVESIEIKDDRPGYCRFKLQSQAQLKEAIDVVLASAQDH